MQHQTCTEAAFGCCAGLMTCARCLRERVSSPQEWMFACVCVWQVSEEGLTSTDVRRRGRKKKQARHHYTFLPVRCPIFRVRLAFILCSFFASCSLLFFFCARRDHGSVNTRAEEGKRDRGSLPGAKREGGDVGVGQGEVKTALNLLFFLFRFSFHCMSLTTFLFRPPFSSFLPPPSLLFC